MVIKNKGNAIAFQMTLPRILEIVFVSDHFYASLYEVYKSFAFQHTVLQ